MTMWENKKYESQKEQIISLVFDQTPIQNGGKSQLEPTLDCLSIYTTELKVREGTKV